MLLKSCSSKNFIINGFLTRIIQCIDNGIKEYDMESLVVIHQDP